MELRSKEFSEKFCREIMDEARMDFMRMYMSFERDLQLYDDDDGKLEYINSKRTELRKKLSESESVYKIVISIKDIENNLMGSLVSFFIRNLISLTRIVEYSTKLKEGQHKLILGYDKLIVYSTSPSYEPNGTVPGFKFSDLDEFKPLLQYLKWGNSLLELNRRWAEFKKEEIVVDGKAHFTDQELDEYFQSWIDGSVKQEDWFNFYGVDVIENLKNYDISEEQLDEIRDHMFELFCEISDNILKNKYITPFNEQILIDNGNKIAKRDLLLINDLINGNIDEIKAVRIKKVFGINDCKQVMVFIEDVLRNYYSLGEDYDLWHAESHLQILAIISYKEFLENYLKDQDEKTHIIIPNLSAENIIDSIETPHQLNGLEINKQEDNNTENTPKQLNVKMIALIHIYEGIQITKDNGSEIAANYSWIAKNSGLGLYQDYTLYLTKDNRRAEPDNLNKKTLRNKIGLFESVLPLLTSERAIKMANEDIQYLKNKYEKTYPEN